MDNLSACSSVGTRQAASLFQLSTRMAPGQEIQRMAKRSNGAGTEHTIGEADERNLADHCPHTYTNARFQSLGARTGCPISFSLIAAALSPHLRCHQNSKTLAKPPPVSSNLDYGTIAIPANDISSLTL
jgi:hypothetical protein